MKEKNKSVNAVSVALTVVCVAAALFGGIAIGGCGNAEDGGETYEIEEVRTLYSFPSGGSGSDSIAEGGLYQGTALYDITLSNKAHLIVLYDNTTNTSSMVVWPDPTSPETGYLYVSPLDRDAVLRRIADREEKDERAKQGENVYSFRMVADQSDQPATTDSTAETTGTVSTDD